MPKEHALFDIATIRSLPRSTTPWQMSFRAAPHEADRAGMYRLLIIVSAGANTIRLMRATTERTLEPAAIVEAVEHAMTQVEGDLVPARPPAILVDDETLREAIELPLQSCGVDVRLQQTLPAIDPVLEALQKKDGLFSDHTLIGTSCYEAELADAAARVAAMEPWRYFIEELPLTMRSDDGTARTVVVMGTNGQCLGVACYDDGSYERFVAASSSERGVDAPIPFNGWSLLFDPACATRAARRRAIAGRQLPIAHALYPQFRRFRIGEPVGEITDRHDARRVERALHALVVLIEERGEAILNGHWEKSVHELPGGTVSFEAQPPPEPRDSSAESPFIEQSHDDDEPLPRLIPDDHVMVVVNTPASHVAFIAPELREHIPSGGDVPCLVVRSTKKSARQAVKALAGLHALAFAVHEEGERDVEVIYGVGAHGPVGIVSAFGTTHDQPTLAEELATFAGKDASHVMVLFVGGGTRRPPTRLHKTDIVGALRLSLLDWR